MAKLSLSPINSRYSSVAALNANFDAIEAAIENTLSLDGTSPNALQADLDMDGNAILNCSSINNVDVSLLVGLDAAVANASTSETNAAASAAAAAQSAIDATNNGAAQVSLAEDAKDAAVVAQGLAEGAQAAAEAAAEAAASPSTITVQRFLGDGVTTAFTLAAAPGASGASVMVYIGGNVQQKNTYSVSGTTLTFTEAPPAPHDGLDNIEVLNFAVTNIGETDANAVNYTPAGTGAVATNVQEKLREFVSVKDFGAVGDGTTDDTAAIQAALDAIVATGKRGTLWFPAGTYKLTASLTVDISRVSIRGQNATLSWETAATSTVGMELTASSSSTVFDQASCIIDGISLAGPGSGTASVGMNFDSTAPYNVAYMGLRDISVLGFYNCLTFRDNTYLISGNGLNLRSDGGACLTDYSGLTNAGERMAFSNCIMSGGLYALICENPNSTWEFVNCSFDCSYTEIYMVGAGQVSCTNCHFEYTGIAVDAQDTGGGTSPTIDFYGCRFIQVDAQAVRANFDCADSTRLTIVGGVINLHSGTATNILMEAGGRLTLLNTMQVNPGAAVNTFNNCFRIYLPNGDGLGVTSTLQVTDIDATTVDTGILTESTGAAWTAYTPTLSADTGAWGTLTVTNARYRTLGKTMLISITCSASVSSGSPTEFRLTLPGGVLGQNSNMYTPALLNNNSVGEIGYLRVAASSPGLRFSRLAGAAFSGACAANGLYVLELA